MDKIENRTTKVHNYYRRLQQPSSGTDRIRRQKFCKEELNNLIDICEKILFNISIEMDSLVKEFLVTR